MDSNLATLDALSAGILEALATPGEEDGMSLPRLGKLLGVGVSVLMRRLSLMGEARLGGTVGPGWIRVTQDGNRWMAVLSDVGRVWVAEQRGSLPRFADETASCE